MIETHRPTRSDAFVARNDSWAPAAAVCLGLASGVSYTGHFLTNALTTTADAIAAIFLLSAPATALAWWAIRKASTYRRFMRSPVLFSVVAVVASILAWSIGTTVVPDAPQMRANLAAQPVRELEVVATGTRNPLARATHVWLIGFERANRTRIPLTEFRADPGWQLRNGEWLAQQPERSVLRWVGQATDDLVLQFRSHEFSGIVEVVWDGTTRTIDLHSGDLPAAAPVTVRLPVVPLRAFDQTDPESISVAVRGSDIILLTAALGAMGILLATASSFWWTRWGIWLGAVLLAAALATSYTAHFLSGSPGGVGDELLRLSYIMILGCAVGYLLIRNVVVSRAKLLSVPILITFAVSSLVVSTILVSGLVNEPPPSASMLSAPTDHRLNVVATGRRNPSSTLPHVWIVALRRGDGSQVPLSEFSLGDGWVMMNNELLAASANRAVATWEGKLTSDMELGLRAHQFGGIVEIEWNGRTEVIDLYADPPLASFTFPLPRQAELVISERDLRAYRTVVLMADIVLAASTLFFMCIWLGARTGLSERVLQQA